MSDFDTLFGSAIEAVNQVFAEAVTYTPPAGAVATDPVSVAKAVVSFETSEEYDTGDGRRRRRVRSVTFVTDSTHPDYSGVADPSDKATVTIGGVTYGVLHTNFEKHGLWTAKLVRTGQVEKTRPHYRERS